jgi:hypothetical protein
MKYKFTNKMAEISGFGGDYEEACRKMIVVGLEWLDKQEGEYPKFRGYKNVTGLIIEENKPAKELTKIMNQVIGDEASGAMMQICVEHILYIKKNGWEKYKEIKVKQKLEETN